MCVKVSFGLTHLSHLNPEVGGEIHSFLTSQPLGDSRGHLRLYVTTQGDVNMGQDRHNKTVLEKESLLPKTTSLCAV